MKKLITTLFLCLTVLTAQAADIDVYIIAGQSNAQGTGYTPDLTGASAVTQYRHDYIAGGDHSQTKTSLAPGLCYGSATGPEVGFGLTLPRGALILKYSQSGTSITQWLGSPNYYSSLISFINTNKSAVGSGNNPVIKGFIWLQGETDAWDSTWASNYQSNLLTFIDNLRSDLDLPNLPIILAEIDQTGSYVQYKSTVNSAQTYVKNNRSHISIVDTTSIAEQWDHLHYTAQGYLELGYRLGQAVNEANLKPGLVALSTRGMITSHSTFGTMNIGFVISGKPTRVIIRAVGPTLGAYGITEAISDTEIEVYNGQTWVASNDNWSSTTASYFSRVGLGGFLTSYDSALIVTLNPGVYSAVVKGKNGATGLVVGEIYYLD